MKNVQDYMTVQCILTALTICRLCLEQTDGNCLCHDSHRLCLGTAWPAYSQAHKSALAVLLIQVLSPDMQVGKVKVGSQHPIALQTMTTTDTRNVQATVDQVSSCCPVLTHDLDCCHMRQTADIPRCTGNPGPHFILAVSPEQPCTYLVATLYLPLHIPLVAVV